ncbi:hypothetical protein M5K25_022574 [Dendrobium thyrsiflorum]|uniref:protein-serine/threonine phosphatase n=1 Tax=Dendrobium thyrsiflorum TaxID=117978 RepID=A0ABD0U6G0_DENTH
MRKEIASPAMKGMEEKEVSLCKKAQSARLRRLHLRQMKAAGAVADAPVKRMREEEDRSMYNSSSESTSPSSGESGLSDHGWVSLIGCRREMEDEVSIEPAFVGREYDFFAVYDGHGGVAVARACRERMHVVLAEEVVEIEEGREEESKWREAMVASFAKVDGEVSAAAADGEEAAERTMGSTAVVAVVGTRRIFVANCGDSRAVLCRGGVAVPLSTDHKTGAGVLSQPTAHKLLALKLGFPLIWGSETAVLEGQPAVPYFSIAPLTVKALEGLLPAGQNSPTSKTVNAHVNGVLPRIRSKGAGVLSQPTAHKLLALKLGFPLIWGSETAVLEGQPAVPYFSIAPLTVKALEGLLPAGQNSPTSKTVNAHVNGVLPRIRSKGVFQTTQPNRPDELERVEAAGGRVINWDGYRILGVLSTSRSIGDYYLKPYVTAEPEITMTERNEKDEFLILASDGLWDVISSEVACRITRQCLSGQAAKLFPHMVNGQSATEAANLLAELAMSQGSRDNISIIVVQLSK